MINRFFGNRSQKPSTRATENASPFGAAKDPDCQTIAVDLIAEILHFVTSIGADATTALEIAHAHFEFELREESQPVPSRPFSKLQHIYTVLILVPEALRDSGDSALWIWEGTAVNKQKAIYQGLVEVGQAFSHDEPEDFEVYGVVPGTIVFL